MRDEDQRKEVMPYQDSGLYGKGYPRGKKTATGRPPCGRATPQTAFRPFGGGPARRAGGLWLSSSLLDTPCPTQCDKGENKGIT